MQKKKKKKNNQKKSQSFTARRHAFLSHFVVPHLSTPLWLPEPKPRAQCQAKTHNGCTQGYSACNPSGSLSSGMSISPYSLCVVGLMVVIFNPASRKEVGATPLHILLRDSALFRALRIAKGLFIPKSPLRGSCNVQSCRGSMSQVK